MDKPGFNMDAFSKAINEPPPNKNPLFDLDSQKTTYSNHQPEQDYGAMLMSDEEFQELLGPKAQQVAPAVGAPATPQSMPDDEFKQLLNPQVAQQVPAGPDYGAMPWSDVAKSAVQNAPSSAWGGLWRYFYSSSSR
jgi:hypothetical protein